MLRQSTVTIDAADGVATEDAVLIASGSVGGAGIGGGLYYSLLISPDLGFSDPTETAHVLATGTDDLTLTVMPAADPSAPRFFKVKASLLKE